MSDKASSESTGSGSKTNTFPTLNAEDSGDLRFRSLVEQSITGVYIIQDGVFKYVNPKLGEIFGYPAQELSADFPVKDLVYEPDREKVRENIRKRVDGEEKSIRYSFRGQRSDGSVIYVEVHGSRSLHNGYPAVIGTLLDITDRIESEQALRQSEERYRNLVDNASDGIFISDRDGNFQSVNPAGCEMLGYMHGELLKMNIRDIIEPENLKQYPIRLPDLHAGKKVVIQRKMQRKDLSILNVEISGKMLPNGQLQGIVRDITERKRAEDALRAEKELSDSIIDSIPGAFYLLNDQVRFVRWNRSMEKLVGYTPHEIEQMSPLDLFYGEDKEKIAASISKVLREGEATIEANLVTKEGYEIPFLLNGRRILINDRPFLIGVGIDITERKKAEDEMLREKAFSDMTIDSIPGMFYLLDEKGNFKRWNKNMTEQTGYSDAEMRSLNALDFFEGKDRELIAERIRDVFEQGHTIVEAEMVYKDGRKIPHIFTGRRVVVNGKQKLLGVGIDTTERNRAVQALRESKERFRRLVESTHAVTWESGPQRRQFSYVGPQAVEMLEYDLKDWYEDYFWQKHIHPDDRERVIKEFDVKTAQSDEFEIQYRFTSKSGKSVWLQDIVSIIRRSGEAQRMQGFLVDITERKQAEQEREELESQLRHSQKLETIGTLAGGIAHDFNNILGPIFGYTELALHDLDDKTRVREELAQVLKAAERARDLTGQILLFSRQGEEERKPLRIQLIIKEVIKFLKASFPATIQLKHRIDNNCKPIMANATQIHQVLTNLCTNAYHAMREKGGVLNLKLETETWSEEMSRSMPRLEKTTEYVKLTVSDSGHGISPHIVERIFEPFFTTKAVGEGTGLGLSVVHGIVTKHGGDISVMSRKGEGTDFYVYLPALESAGDMDVDEKTSLPVGNETIMCIDDEKEIVNMEKITLERLGYKVLAYSSSARALADFKKEPHMADLVLTDQTMPELTGMQMAGEMLKINPDLPIVLLTGFSESVTEEAVKKAGIREMLLKPFSIGQLAGILRSALEKQA